MAYANRKPQLSTLQWYLIIVDTSNICILILDFVSPTPILGNALFLSSTSHKKSFKTQIVLTFISC